MTSDKILTCCDAVRLIPKDFILYCSRYFSVADISWLKDAVKHRWRAEMTTWAHLFC